MRTVPTRRSSHGKEAVPSTAQIWRPLTEELDRWTAVGRVAHLWLRDDDAVAPTPALDLLLELTECHHVPVLLAVIPLAATSDLADRLRDVATIVPCQHGCAHRNHAGPDEKKQELGNHRPLAAIIDELAGARDRLADLFGRKVAPILVPPWNRIAAEVAAQLPGLGFAALSTFGSPKTSLPGRQINCDVDIVDWKGGRRGRDPAALVAGLTAALAAARVDGSRPIGVLTHHLVHDATAWSFLEELFRFTTAHAAAAWIGVDALLGQRSGA